MDAAKVDSDEVSELENGSDSEVSDDEDDIVDDDGGESDGEHTIQFKEMVYDVVDRIDKAKENEEYKKLPKADWDRHWRQIFDQIQRDVSADERFPIAITNPPVYSMLLKCSDEFPPMGCPCCLEDYYLQVVKIEVPRKQPNGVTKDLLVAKICEALHGTEEAPGGLVGATTDKMVLNGADWMIHDGGCLMYDTIFLYCQGMTSRT